MKSKYSIIILAGGVGKRFGQQKQFVNLYDKPLWEWVYSVASSYSNDIVIVGIDVKPGDTRSRSVINGLNKLSSCSERVIILEAARPLVKSYHIEKLLGSDQPSTSFYIPMAETIILKEYIDTPYISREKCLSFQTPQAFNTKMLIDAYSNEIKPDFTDETSLMFKYYNIYPELLLGDQNLIKVTYPIDLEIVKHLYNEKIK